MLTDFQQKLMQNLDKIMKDKQPKIPTKTKPRKQSNGSGSNDLADAEKLFDQIQDDLPSMKHEDQNDSQQQMSEEEPQKDQEESDEEEDEDQQVASSSNKQPEFQKKIRSILKDAVESIQKSKNEKKEKKSVSFVIKGDEGQKISTGSRRWKEKLKNPRKGKFDIEEESALKKSLGEVITEYGISFEDAVQSLSEEQEKIPRNLQLWTKVCSVLPDRTIMSSYKFLKRLLCVKNNSGPWTEEQTDTLLNLIEKNGRKWSMIASKMNRTAENVRDKYRSLGEENNQEIQKQFWSLEELIIFLKYLKKYSKVDFLDERIQRELENAASHNEIEKSQRSKRKYNSKSFVFHNNEIVRKYINSKYNSIKMEDINWKKISDKLGTKTIFDCRNKFVQLLQLEIFSMPAKKDLDQKIVDFVSKQKVRDYGQIDWKKWGNIHDVPFTEAKNRFMVLKNIILGRKQKEFKELLALLREKVK